jgi:threonyl-tRNA synthetase
MCLIDESARNSSVEEIKELKNAMKDIISRNLEISTVRLGYSDAIEYFHQQNKSYSVALVETSNEFSVRCSACIGHLER